MEQTLTITAPNGTRQEMRWEVDLQAAGQVQRWVGAQPGLLAEEVAEMATYFPRWVLALAHKDELCNCHKCGELIVFRDGAARCVSCGARAKLQEKQQLAWVGHLPTLVGDLPRALRQIRSKPDPAYPLVEVGGALLWLVPIMGFYTESWPTQRPTMKYDKRLFSILGIASPSASHHIVGGNTMCLYGGEPWRQVSMRSVLQQRVVNHLASMLKIGDGQQPVTAFAGKQHVYNDWYDR